MNAQFWFWLLIIIGSLVANVIKKSRAMQPALPRKKKPGAQSYAGELPTGKPFPDERVKPASGELAEPVSGELAEPLTFEELLKEIEGSRHPAQVKRQEQNQQPVYQDTIMGKKQVLENTDYDYRKEDSIYEIYENAKKEAFSRPSLKETLKLQSTPVVFGAFKGYQRQASTSWVRAFAQEIRQPSGFKKAFIMSEVMKRKF